MMPVGTALAVASVIIIVVIAVLIVVIEHGIDEAFNQRLAACQHEHRCGSRSRHGKFAHNQYSRRITRTQCPASFSLKFYV